MAQASFYSTMAQVIPLVFLALLLEMRVLDGGSECERFGEGLSLLALIVAETVALGAVYTGHTSDTIFTLVVAGAGIGAVTILFAAIEPVALVWVNFALANVPGASRLGVGVVLRVLLYGFIVGLFLLLAVLF